MDINITSVNFLVGFLAGFVIAGGVVGTLIGFLAGDHISDSPVQVEEVQEEAE